MLIRWLFDGLISIHSPHTRGDDRAARNRQSAEFQSTPLIRGETFFILLNVPRVVAFQSTPLIRGETISGQ